MFARSSSRQPDMLFTAVRDGRVGAPCCISCAHAPNQSLPYIFVPFSLLSFSSPLSFLLSLLSLFCFLLLFSILLSSPLLSYASRRRPISRCSPPLNRCDACRVRRWHVPSRCVGGVAGEAAASRLSQPVQVRLRLWCDTAFARCFRCFRG